MDRLTVEIYERRAGDYERLRPPRHSSAAVAFAQSVPEGVRADLGCGPGIYTEYLGSPVLALDAAFTMVARARERAPHALPVQADLEALPLRRRSLHAAWSRMAYQHVPRERLPIALAELHWALDVGSPAVLQLDVGEGHGRRTTADADDIEAGRYFAGWTPETFRHLLVGAGFTVEATEVEELQMTVHARRALSLPDTVAPRMRLLMCGLNPAVYAAERGIGFARPGNRYWPAMVAAGLATVERDPLRLLREHDIGMTDLVKRATSRASDLDPAEYAEGWKRLDWLASWLEPGAVVFVGLDGWRRVVDARARAGWQPETIGGRPAYVMPSTSGLNAHTRFDDFVEHLRVAAAGPP